MDDIYKINKYHLGLGKDNLNHTRLVTKTRIEQVCTNEQDYNSKTKKEWIKLTKSQKLKAMKAYSRVYADVHDNLQSKTDNEKENITRVCWTFLRDAMDKKRIANKDVVYDVEEGKISEIKSLVYNDDLQRFALKRGKNGSSISGLPNFKLSVAHSTNKNSKNSKNSKNNIDEN